MVVLHCYMQTKWHFRRSRHLTERHAPKVSRWQMARQIELVTSLYAEISRWLCHDDESHDAWGSMSRT